MKRYKCTGFFSLGCLLTMATFTVLAQETEAPQPAVVEEGVVQFIDVPVAIDPESDFALPPAPQAIDPEQDPLFQERLRNIRSYNSTVQQLEQNGGAWTQQLTEELTALGTLQQQQSLHLEAVETFNRAIHINRINSGLHTLEQIPLVEKMIDSFLAMGDWGQADLYNNYLFFVQQKAYGTGDPRLVPVLERLANWNIQAFNIGYGESLAMRLSSAQMLFHTAANIVGLHFGSDDERYIKNLYGIANSAYLVAKNPELLREVDRIDFRSTQQLLRDQLDAGNWIIPRGFMAGEDALLTIADYYAALPGKEWELARVTADIGDWYLLFQRRGAAEEKYQQAWEILAALENGAELQQRLFGQVQPIPTYVHDGNALLEANVSSVGNSALSYDFVDLVLDVSENGMVRNIRLANDGSRASDDQVNRIRRLVRETSFRPLVINGERLRSTDNYFRYRYWY